MEKIKNNIISFFKNNKVLWIILLIVLMFLGNMTRVEFSRCTFRMYSTHFMGEYKHYLIIGRYFAALFWRIVSEIGLSLSKTYFISYVLGIISLTLSVFFTFKILKKYIKSNFLNLLVSSAVIINSFFIDYFIYIEKGIFTSSILFSVLAIKFLIDFFETKKKRNLIYSFILLCLSSFSYQGTVAMFIAFATIFIVKYSDNIKKFFINTGITALIYGTTMGISYLLVRIVGGQSTSRTSGSIDIKESINKILYGMKKICIESYGTMPKYFFVITFIIVFLLVGFIIFKFGKNYKENKKESKLILILGYIYSLAGCIVACILPEFFIDTSAVDISARAIYPFASIIALSIIYVFVNINVDKKIFSNIFIGLLLLFLSIQCYEYNKIITDHYTLNYIEKNVVLSIGEQIEKYEKENNIEVKNIIFYTDKNSSTTYPDLKSYSDINERVLRTTWCRLNIINYYMNRQFEQGYDKNEQIEKEFKSVDYNNFNIEQLKFDKDTLHLCIY